MNHLLVGTDKTPLFHTVPESEFLLIDDGPFIDGLHRRARLFDVHKHNLNPLKDMSYTKALSFIEVLKAAFPGGANTLTKETAFFQILEALQDPPRTLDQLIKDTKETAAAYQMLRRVLMSPVLEPVLNRGTNFSMNGTIVARLSRAELGDFDAFILGNLLIASYPGQVIVPDLGFYACAFHRVLIRQGRLIAGVNSLDEVPELRSDLLLIEDKRASCSTAEDAETLAKYQCPFVPGTTGYGDFIRGCMESVCIVP